MSGPGDLPAIEGPGLGLPMGMTRRAMSYDDNMDAPMAMPDISINKLWGRPIIPERRFSHQAEEEQGVVGQYAEADAPSRSSGVVKSKASSMIIKSLITKQTQNQHDSMYRFEQRAGLTDTSYTPHKGLTAEETRYHQRMPESIQKLQIQSMEEAREERPPSSAQSTPSNTPHSSPKQQRRNWLSSTGSDLSVGSNSSVDLGGDSAAGVPGAGLPGAGGGGGAADRWSVFGPRPLVHTSTSDLGSDHTAGGFALQAYRGAQKPTPMEMMKAQATRLADDPVTQKIAPPQMEIPTVEPRRQARSHKLKPRDMNILTPSGF